MELLEIIKTRRSIRVFKKEAVPDELINTVLEAGMNAPSSKNSQPWRFIVIKNKELITELGELLINSENDFTEPCDPRTGKIKEGVMTTIRPSGYLVKMAPVLLVIENTCPFSHNRDEVMNGIDKKRSIGGHDSEVISVSCAIQNISLQAHALGLGTIVICDILAEEEKVKERLELKGDLVAVMPLGYPEHVPEGKSINKDCVRYID